MEFDDMGLGDEELIRAATPDGLVEAAMLAADESLPSVSKDRYNKAYSDFKKWQTEQGASSMSERVVLAYFAKLSETYKPSSLWSYYSMLKSTMRVKDNLDIATYKQLTGFLKTKSAGYKSNKAKIFTEEEMRRFMTSASDEAWLDVKVRY